MSRGRLIRWQQTSGCRRRVDGDWVEWISVSEFQLSSLQGYHVIVPSPLGWEMFWCRFLSLWTIAVHLTVLQSPRCPVRETQCFLFLACLKSCFHLLILVGFTSWFPQIDSLPFPQEKHFGKFDSVGEWLVKEVQCCSLWVLKCHIVLPHPGGFSFKNMRNDTIILPAIVSIWCQLERPNREKKPWSLDNTSENAKNNQQKCDKLGSSWHFSHLSARQAKGQGVAASKEDTVAALMRWLG